MGELAMRKYWILIAALAAVACAKNEVETAPEGKTWTVEVDALKWAEATTKALFEHDGWEGGGIVAGTKALDLDNGYLSAYWSGTDKIEVYDVNGDGHRGTLTTPGGGSICRFRGTISGTVNTGDRFTLLYPEKPADSREMYARQKGTLEDIAKRYDYALATVDVTSVDNASSKIVLSDATLVSRQSITLFSFNYIGCETNKITRLTLTSWSLDNPVTVVPDAPGTEFVSSTTRQFPFVQKKPLARASPCKLFHLNDLGARPKRCRSTLKL